MKNEDRLQELRDRFEFDSWAGRTTGDYNLFFLNVLLTAFELRGWERETPRRMIESEGIRSRAWFWQSSTEEKARIRVDVAEYPSISEARHALLKLLGEFQSPQLRLLKDGPGDVAFDVGRPSTMISVRGNLVQRIINAGHEVVEVTEMFHALDGFLTARGEQKRPEVPGPHFEQLRIEPERPALEQLAHLKLEARDPLRGEIAFKIFSPGVVSRHEDELEYRRSSGEEETLVVYAWTEAGGMSEERIQIERLK